MKKISFIECDNKNKKENDLSKIDKGRILLHIPHGSNELPKSFYNNISISDELINNIEEYFIDKGVDEIFIREGINYVRFPYSRIYCDVERYLDEEKEKMTQIGQ